MPSRGLSASVSALAFVGNGGSPGGGRIFDIVRPPGGHFNILPVSRHSCPARLPLAQIPANIGELR